jgi:hypothetical protein
MRRRRPLLFLFVAAVAAVAFGWIADFQWPRAPQVKAKQFDSVSPAMTREDVIATVGGPPGDYRTDERLSPLRPFWRGEPVVKLEHWLCNDGLVFVVLDEEDRVVRTHIERMVDLRPNRLRWLTRQLGE